MYQSVVLAVSFSWTTSSTSFMVNYFLSSSHISSFSFWIPFFSSNSWASYLLRLFISTQVRNKLDKPSSSRTFRESLVAIIICFFPFSGEDLIICWMRCSSALLYFEDSGTYSISLSKSSRITKLESHFFESSKTWVKCSAFWFSFNL